MMKQMAFQLMALLLGVTSGAGGGLLPCRQTTQRSISCALPAETRSTPFPAARHSRGRLRGGESGLASPQQARASRSLAAGRSDSTLFPTDSNLPHTTQL